MKKIDMKLLRKSAALLPLVALPVVATPAHAQDTDTYRVVINHEEQYSIWLIGQEVTGKWRETGEVCSLKDCMSYIEGVWTDMRPLSLRQKNDKP